MAEEFVINSSAIETKINQLLPSQGGFQPGQDFSASTMVIPIVDLTETAEGSSLRQDLQISISFSTATAFSVNNGTTTIINTTGFWRLIGTMGTRTDSSTQKGSIVLNDGTTDKIIFALRVSSNAVGRSIPFDLLIKLPAGHSCKMVATNGCVIDGSSRQIADIAENLVNP